MMAQSQAESTKDTYNYGQYINQFPPNTMKVIREFERIQKKICRHKMSIMFNEIYIYIYIYIIIIIPVLVVTKSICGFVANQVQYNMESAQYLGYCYNIIIIIIINK